MSMKPGLTQLPFRYTLDGVIDTDEFPVARRARNKAAGIADTTPRQQARQMPPQSAECGTPLRNDEVAEEVNKVSAAVTPQGGPDGDAEAKRLERLRKAKLKQQEFDRIKRKRTLTADNGESTSVSANSTTEASTAAECEKFLAEDNDDFWTNMSQMQEEASTDTTPKRTRKGRSAGVTTPRTKQVEETHRKSPRMTAGKKKL